MNPRRSGTTFLVALMALTLAACGSDEGGDETHDELAAEACEHAEDGPFVDLTAAAVPDATAPRVEAGHDAHRITLAPGETGWASFASAEAGTHAFFLSADVPFVVQDDAGSEVPAAHVEPVDACEALEVLHEVNLSVGLHLLRLGPVAEGGTVVLVAEASHP